MENSYKLHRLRELADNDEEFLIALAQTFLEEVPADANTLKEAVENENYMLTYQTAHKMKPTIDVFELGVLNELIDIQDWGKYEKRNEDISMQLHKVLKAIKATSDELKIDFNL